MIIYLGIITYLLLVFTASISVMNIKFKIHIIPMKWHSRVAILGLIFATIHGALGIYYRFFI